ncbi:polysaccharide pyruvyl transferase family protein [Microbacterium sp. ARD32]|nr:polysaccharide pyruvyl transferase family protein [Microbacterium sp. ARD32]
MPERILVLWADESSPNLGVAVLARGSRDLLRRAYPHAEFTFANFGSAPRQIPWGAPRSLVRERLLPRFGMQKYFADFSLIWDTRSGDSFADIYGLRRHLTMGLVHEFASEARTPIAMAPQTIGPFNTRRGRALARRNLARSRFVFSRDPESTRVSAELGRTPDLTTADLVFAIDQPAVGQTRDVLVNVSGLLWNDNPHVPADIYRRVITETVEHLRAAGREVALLAHVLDSPMADNDVPAIRSLAAQLGEDIELVVPTSLDSVRETIAGARVVVGSRMHACLNALSVGVPAVPLAYSRKFAPLLNSVGWTTGFDLRTDDADTLPRRVETAVAQVDRSAAQQAAATGRRTLDDIVALLGAAG